MEEQQKMSLVLSHFIGNTSSVHGKGNEIQQQCRPIPDEFSHHAPGRAVLLENNFSKSATSVSHGDQKSFPQYFYNYSVNLHNYYNSRWVWTLNPCEHCSKVFTRPKQPVKLRVPYSHFGCNSLRLWFFIQLFARQCPYHVISSFGTRKCFRSFLKLKVPKTSFVYFKDL